MADSWYYVQGGTRHGPVSTEQLQGLLGSGSLLPTDNIWKEGMSNWMMAGQVPGLLPPAPAAPPPVVHAPATPPVQAGPVTPAIPAQPKAPLEAINRTYRMLLIVAAGALIVAFFTPYFYAWATGHVPLKVGEWEVPRGEDINNKTMSGLPFGWSFWWGILIFIFAWFALAAAILDLTLNVRIVRTINKWVMVGIFGLATLLPLIHIPLSIFGIGMGNVSMTSKDDPTPATPNEGEDSLGRLKTLIKNQFKNGTPEQKKDAEKAAGDTYLSVGAIPIGSVITLAGGALGTAICLLIIRKKQ